MDYIQFLKGIDLLVIIDIHNYTNTTTHYVVNNILQTNI